MKTESVTQLFNAVDSRDWETLNLLFHEDIVYERPGYPPFAGRERVLDFYKNERIIASGKHHLEQIVVNDESGACWGRFIGTLKNGKAVDERFADVYSYEDGKIKERRSYFFRPAV
jgi:ketosteroid isomerase-like protein